MGAVRFDDKQAIRKSPLKISGGRKQTELWVREKEHFHHFTLQPGAVT
jgi:hypothetical protein